MDAASAGVHALANLACVVGVTYTSLVLIRPLKIQGSARGLLALAILNCAQIVLAVEILSLLGAIALLNLLILHASVCILLKGISSSKRFLK